jgi:hypothetical protein
MHPTKVVGYYQFKAANLPYSTCHDVKINPDSMLIGMKALL